MELGAVFSDPRAENSSLDNIYGTGGGFFQIPGFRTGWSHVPVESSLQYNMYGTGGGFFTCSGRLAVYNDVHDSRSSVAPATYEGYDFEFNYFCVFDFVTSALIHVYLPEYCEN